MSNTIISHTISSEEYSKDLREENHIVTSAETPMRADAFDVND